MNRSFVHGVDSAPLGFPTIGGGSPRQDVTA